MKKLLSLFLVTSVVGLFGCGKKKELKHSIEKCDINLKLQQKATKTITNTTYQYDEEDGYRFDRIITTKYDSLDREIDVLHKLYSVKDDNWRDYIRYVYEYDDTNNTSSCYLFGFVKSLDRWAPESKIITTYNDNKDITYLEEYQCTDYSSEDYETKFELVYTRTYTYDNGGKLTSYLQQNYQGLPKVFMETKTDYTYDNDKIETIKTYSRLAGKNEEFNLDQKVEYEYENDLLDTKTIYNYDNYEFGKYCRTKYNYIYQDGKTKEEIKYIETSTTKFIDNETTPLVFVEDIKKVYEYDSDLDTVYMYKYSDIYNIWQLAGKETILTEYN